MYTSGFGKLQVYLHDMVEVCDVMSLSVVVKSPNLEILLSTSIRIEHCSSKYYDTEL